MNVKLVINLRGGGYITTTMSADDASATIDAWIAAERKTLSGENGGKKTWACLMSEITGMYTHLDTPGSQDRMANAVEKIAEQAAEGEGWKG